MKIERELSDPNLTPMQSFRRAKVAFQKSCPVIKKDKAVLNKDDTPRYRYASLGAIADAIKDGLAENGFSYWWSDEGGDDKLMVTCHLDHIDGHSESSTFPVHIFSGYGTNKAQDGGSANTFGKRYSLANVLGLTVDDDDDGAGAAQYNSEFLVHHNAVVREWLQTILATKDAIEMGDTSAAAEAIAEMPMKAWKTLWVAPSNGGIWTTEERKFMKDDSEFKDLVHQRRTESGWYDNPENKL